MKKEVFTLWFEYNENGENYYKVLDSDGADPIGEYITLEDGFLKCNKYSIERDFDYIEINTKKTFLIVDKTGRGFKRNNIVYSELLTWEDEEGYEEQTLQNWAEEAEEGEEWESNSIKIICTKS
jgi:hypothetical protein